MSTTAPATNDVCVVHHPDATPCATEEGARIVALRPAPTPPNDWPPLIGLGRAMRVARERGGWSVTEFALCTGLKRSRLQAIEDGTAGLSFWEISSIAAALSLAPSRLVELGESETTWMLERLPF